MGRRWKKVPNIWGPTRYELETEREAKDRREGEEAVAELLFSGIAWLVCLPFKIIGWIFIKDASGESGLTVFWIIMKWTTLVTAVCFFGAKAVKMWL